MNLATNLARGKGFNGHVLCKLLPVFWLNLIIIDLQEKLQFAHADEQVFLYKNDPNGTDPVVEYEHEKIKSSVDHTLPNVQEYLKNNPEATDDVLRWDVTDHSYYSLALPRDTVCIVEFYAPW